MTDLRKAAEMALDVLESYPLPFQFSAREALRQALAQISPSGYALIHEDALRAWGKLDEIKAACCYSAQPEQDPVDVVKVEHARCVELAEMYERGWNAALAKRKPVAWMYVNDDGECEQIEYGDPFDDPSVTPLYTAPPKREWVGLTDEEIDDRTDFRATVRYFEAKLKEKNGG